MKGRKLHHLGLEPSDSLAPVLDCTSTYNSDNEARIHGRRQSDAETAPSDPDLDLIRAAWPTLPSGVRIGIMAMVRASTSR